MKKVTPDKNEILRYMGCVSDESAKERYSSIIDDCIREIEAIYRPKATYRVFDIEKRDIDKNLDLPKIKIKNTNLCLCGHDIASHLSGSGKCVLLAATLGIEVDNLIRRTQSTDMLKALVLNSCAVEFIEKICDNIQNEIRETAIKEGWDINFRFSPGYGDLPISLQGDILAVLDTMRRIGLTATENSILVPSKSVTAIIGYVKPKDKNIDTKTKVPCDTCTLKNNCMFKKGGTTCERGRIYKA